MDENKQNNVITDTNEPIENITEANVEQVVDDNVNEAVLQEQISDVEQDEIISEAEQATKATDDVCQYQPMKIIDDKNASLTKIEAFVMFLSIVAIIFTTGFFLMFNLGAKIDHLMDYSKLINQKVSYLDVQVQDLKEQAIKDEFDQSAFLGITYIENEQDGLFLGVKVESVLEYSPAAEAGIKAGDYIVAVDGEKIDTFAKLGNIITAHNAGDTLHITIATVENNQIINKDVHATLTYRGNFDIQTDVKD